MLQQKRLAIILHHHCLGIAHVYHSRRVRIFQRMLNEAAPRVPETRHTPTHEMSRSTASEWRTIDKPIHTANVARALYDARIARGIARLEELEEFSNLEKFRAFGADMLAKSPHLHPRPGFEHTEYFRRDVKRKYDALFGDDDVDARTMSTTGDVDVDDVAADADADAQSPLKTQSHRDAARAEKRAPLRHALFWPLSIFATTIIAALIAIVFVLLYDACRDAACRD